MTKTEQGKNWFGFYPDDSHFHVSPKAWFLITYKKFFRYSTTALKYLPELTLLNLMDLYFLQTCSCQ